MAFTPVVALNASNASVSMGAFQDAAGINYPCTSYDSNRATYRATASFTPFATAALALFNIQGSATKTVRITKIMLGGVATALADTLFRMTRLTAVGAGGTGVAPTIGKMDSGNAVAATAVVTHYTTAAQSVGTAAYALATWRQFIGTVTTPATAWIEQGCVFPEKGSPVGQALVLRGTSDWIQVENLNAGNLGAGTVLEYTIEWVEDAS